MPVVAVISVDAYPFLSFSDLTYCLADTQEQVFSGCTVPPDSEETELGSSNQEFIHRHVKIPGWFQCHVAIWKYIHTAISGGVEISEVPGCQINKVPGALVTINTERAVIAI